MPRQGPDQGGTERGHRASQGQQGPVLEAENQHQASALAASQDKDRPPRGGRSRRAAKVTYKKPLEQEPERKRSVATRSTFSLMASGGAGPAHTLILDFQLPDCEGTDLSFKPPGP